MRIFISYDHDDKEKAIELVDSLSPYHQCWIDKRSIRAGDDWQNSIEAAIARCDYFLFLASWESLKSPHCEDEIEAALGKRKKIIPIVLVDPIVMRPELSKLQWIFWEPDGIQRLLAELQPSSSKWWKVVALVELIIILLMTAQRVTS